MLIAKAPFTITRILTDNGKEFTDRFCATGERQPTRCYRFDSAESLAQTIERSVQVYNQHIPHKVLGHIAPIQALKY